MAETCNWILFYAHSARLNETEDEHPDFYGVFAVPQNRREPELLLDEVLSNRKLFLARVVENRRMNPADDWGMNERLKAQVEEQGYALSLTKVQHGAQGD